LAVWWRKAIEAFPQMRRWLNDAEFSIYMLYFDLLPMTREAHESRDLEFLERIYDYAEWCLRQKELFNAVSVAFYEHLFDSHPKLWEEMIAYMSPFVIKENRELWESRWKYWQSGRHKDELSRLTQLLDIHQVDHE
jgi:hypothetical protein